MLLAKKRAADRRAWLERKDNLRPFDATGVLGTPAARGRPGDIQRAGRLPPS